MARVFSRFAVPKYSVPTRPVRAGQYSCNCWTNISANRRPRVPGRRLPRRQSNDCGALTVQPIPEIRDLDRNRFEREILADGKPVVLRGLVGNWPAVQRGWE